MGEEVGLPSNNLAQCLKELFSCIEELYEGGHNIGEAEKLFTLLEMSMDTLPVSVGRLLVVGAWDGYSAGG